MLPCVAFSEGQKSVNIWELLYFRYYIFGINRFIVFLYINAPRQELGYLKIQLIRQLAPLS